MSVILFKDGKSERFDEYTFVDRLKEGWSLTDGVEEDSVAEDDNTETGNWIHSGELPDNPTDEEVLQLANKAEIPYVAMKNSDTLRSELGYEYQG